VQSTNGNDSGVGNEEKTIVEGGYHGYLESEEQWRRITSNPIQCSNSGKNLLTFAKFTAEWCKPCKATEPVFLELAEDKKDHAVFVNVDVDKHDEIAAENHAVVIPLIVCYKDGQKIDRHTGKDTEQMRLFVQDMLTNHGEK
jgi:thiol-disulfide isomerase/thioredoxin